MRRWLGILGLVACVPPTKDVGDVDQAAACEPDEPLGGGAYWCHGASEHQHQREPASCELMEPPPCTMPNEIGCTASSDCEGGEICIQAELVFDGDPACACVPPPCAMSADCDEGRSCWCGNGDPHGSCIESNCESDADCGGYLCAYSSNCTSSRLFCTTPDDLCEPASSGSCEYVAETGRWEDTGLIGCD